MQFRLAGGPVSDFVRLFKDPILATGTERLTGAGTLLMKGSSRAISDSAPWSEFLSTRRRSAWSSLWQPLKRQFVADLKQLLERLLDADIEFFIAGGFAAVPHGSTMVTRDLDVCTLLKTPDPGVPVKNLYLETDAGAIDFLASINGARMHKNGESCRRYVDRQQVRGRVQAA